MRQVHVIPDGPTEREHTAGVSCWCLPEIATAGERTIKVTHRPEQEASDGH